MEVEKKLIRSMNSAATNVKINIDHHHEKDDDDVPLPGFRFHPTDEELVGFYLRRKVGKLPISIELIKHVDIYKYDPWDLPKGSNVGDNEWYFFCKRGRKYRNSIRPNRVTGSGFWKATGIDRPIYSSAGGDCIGLKKSLVYYRGSAGKGTKTDWMMHEFRLPADHDDKSTKHMDVKSIPQEAEVWTLCRIFKRNASYRKCIPDSWREVTAKQNLSNTSASLKSCSSLESNNCQSYIGFKNPVMARHHEKKHFFNNLQPNQQVIMESQTLSSISHQMPSTITSYSSSFCGLDLNEFLKFGEWNEFRSAVDCLGSVDPFLM